MNSLDFFRHSCFPGGPDPKSSPDSAESSSTEPVFTTFINSVLNRSRTQPRWDALSVRHPGNRGGMIVDENGNVALRAGHDEFDHSIGASVIITEKGRVLITAPGGIGISGAGVSTSVKPSEALRFLGGRFRFNPAWEDDAYTLTPIDTLDDVYVLKMIGKQIVPVPIVSIFNSTPLYTKTDG